MHFLGLEEIREMCSFCCLWEPGKAFFSGIKLLSSSTGSSQSGASWSRDSVTQYLLASCWERLSALQKSKYRRSTQFLKGLCARLAALNTCFLLEFLALVELCHCGLVPWGLKMRFWEIQPGLLCAWDPLLKGKLEASWGTSFSPMFPALRGATDADRPVSIW